MYYISQVFHIAPRHAVVSQSLLFKFRGPGQSSGNGLLLEGPRMAGFRKAPFARDGVYTIEELLQFIWTCGVIWHATDKDKKMMAPVSLVSLLWSTQDGRKRSGIRWDPSFWLWQDFCMSQKGQWVTGGCKGWVYTSTREYVLVFRTCPSLWNSTSVSAETLQQRWKQSIWVTSPITDFAKVAEKRESCLSVTKSYPPPPIAHVSQW